MVSRWGYADYWDAFMNKIENYSMKQKHAMFEECRRENGRIGMIVELSQEWRTRESGARAADKRDQRRRRIAEEMRWIRVDRELTSYVDPRTRALMPIQRTHRVSHPDRKTQNAQARSFFRQLDRGHLHGRSIPRIIERTYRVSSQGWAAAHPYGPPPSREQVTALRDSIIRFRPSAIRRPNPLAMSHERATAIVLHLLSRIA